MNSKRRTGLLVAGVLTGLTGFTYNSIQDANRRLEETAICAHAASQGAQAQEASVERCLDAVAQHRQVQREKFFRSEVDPFDEFAYIGASMATIIGIYAGLSMLKEYVNRK